MKLVEGLDKEALRLKHEIFKICWYMRGMPINDGFALSYEDRKIISDIVADNIDVTKKSGLPFF